MRRWMLLIAVWLFAVAPVLAAPAEQPQRVLFVGNSLTYYGNLPATFAALAKANGHDVQSEMIVEGGATLAERVADGSVQQALQQRRPAVVVLQERGGDLLCRHVTDVCTESRQALDVLARAAHAINARVLVLGTYQPVERVSIELVRAEGDAARRAGADYVEVSETLRALSASLPDLAWHAADGMHPGPALTLLDALQLHRTLYGTLSSRPFEVTAPIYGADSGLEPTLRQADAPPPRPGTPGQIRYEQSQVQRINASLASSAR